MTISRLPRQRPGTASHGFTLIEILVVLVVVGILYSVVVLSLGVIGDDRELQRETRRLGSLLELAGEEAELQGRDFGVEFMRQGYRFVEYDPVFERWGEILGDEVLRERQLAEDLELQLYIEDRRIDLAEEAADTATDEDEDAGPLLDKYAPHGLILSSGDRSPLYVDVLRLSDDTIVRVTIEPDGSIKIGEDDDEFE
jgi:general secretion pathway protein H